MKIEESHLQKENNWQIDSDDEDNRIKNFDDEKHVEDNWLMPFDVEETGLELLMSKLKYAILCHQPASVFTQLLAQSNNNLIFSFPNLCPIKAMGNVQWNLLQLACKLGTIQAISCLTNLNEIINARFKNDDPTALHFAVHAGYIDIVKILLANNADPNLQERRGFTALHIAIEKKQYEIIQVLLDAQANVNSKINNEQTTPLHLAVMAKDCKAIALLLPYVPKPLLHKVMTVAKSLPDNAAIMTALEQTPAQNTMKLN